MDYEKAKEYVFRRLTEELPSDLTYHSIEHTKDVIEAAERLGKMENVSEKELLLLKTAALYHDLGFVETYKGHEKVSARLARETLPQFGYSKEDIEQIEKMILATEVPQSPESKLEKILADADLDYLGRDDLFLIGQRLQYEWKKHGLASTLKEWHEKQLNFLKNHKYFTNAARKLRRSKKLKNITEIEKLMGKK